MIEENRKEFEICNIVEYHNAGITGENITIVVLDDNEKPLPFMDYVHLPFGWFEDTKQHHSTVVIRVLHEVAPSAKIISLPYINEATTQMKNDSIQWIIDHKNEIDIINCSFKELANGLMTRLEGLNIPIVCSSGNDGFYDKLRYPANYPWTIAVGALEEYRDLIAGYSNSGEELDCLGYTKIFIPTTKKDRPMEFEGTSCAAPFVAGMLALLMSKTGVKHTGTEAKEIIKYNCIDYYEEGKDFKSGYGLMVLPGLEELKMRDINLLHPELQVKARKLIELTKQKLGLNIIISETFRTKAEQNALYAKGRTAPGSVMTKVQFPYSLHNWAIAFDIAVIINGKANWDLQYYKKIAPIGKSLGLESGGDWKSFKDWPHYQLPGYSVSALLNKYKTPENFISLFTKANINDTKKEEDNVAGFEGDAVVKFEGKELKSGILDGRTYVELRSLAEMLGLIVGWDNINKVATLSRKK